MTPPRAARPFRRALMRGAAALAMALAVLAPAQPADEPHALVPFTAAAAGAPPAPWHFTTLPHKQPTRFDVVDLDGARVLRVQADASYGLLAHRVRLPLDAAAALAWRWRVDRFVEGADLHTRAGDDGAAKLCVFFDYPAERLSLMERTRLALARRLSGEAVPSEALCYVWDAHEAPGTVLANAFTDRMRMMVLASGSAPSADGWRAERRPLLADYRRAFGAEAGALAPDVAAVVVSADADNTQAHGLAYFSDIALTGAAPPPAWQAGGRRTTGTAE